MGAMGGKGPAGFFWRRVGSEILNWVLGVRPNKREQVAGRAAIPTDVPPHDAVDGDRDSHSRSDVTSTGLYIRYQGDSPGMMPWPECAAYLVRLQFDARPDDVQTLARIRRREIYQDEFGDECRDRWLSKLDDYILRKMECDPDQWLRTAIEEHISRAQDGAEPTDPPDASPLEFEQRCARYLENRGFQIRLVGAVGDQGADIIAERDSLRIAVQCKRYSSPAGNSSVQEVVAARFHYDCSHAIVVAPSGFTASARQLAKTARVALLSPEELCEFRDDMLVDFPSEASDER